jgi:hypothetical protein
MSELRQRLLRVAKLPLALIHRLPIGASLLGRLDQLLDRAGANGSSVSSAGPPSSGALVMLSERGKALMTLPARGRALVELMPQPVQVELAKLSTRGAHVCREVFAGILVVGLIVIVGGYGRLAEGPISLPTLVPTIEMAINDQLSELRVEIDDAVLQRSDEGPGVLFRLRNIRLVDQQGSIVAQAPLAAIGLSATALLSGRIAPGSVDFIGPRLVFYSSDDGVSLSFYRPSAGGSAQQNPSMPLPADAPRESVVTKQEGVPTARSGRELNVTQTITEVFERARRGDTSYLSRFGVKDAQVVLSDGGVETLWQVPDFSIDLEHRSGRSILLGQANLASSKGDWQLEVRTEERPKRQTLLVTALIQNLVPSGLVETFSNVAALKAFDIPITGEASGEITQNGKFVSGEAVVKLQPGYITPPWDPGNAMLIEHGNLRLRYLKKTGIIEIEPSTLGWGKSKTTIGGRFERVGEEQGKPIWAFKLNATDTELQLPGLAPLSVDEWSAEGSISSATGSLTLSRFVIRSGTAAIELAGRVVQGPDSPEIQLTGTVSAMPVDALKLLWPKFLAGDARKWVLKNIGGGQLIGGKVSIALGPGELARIIEGVEPAPEAVNVELDLNGMALTYIEKMPPIVTADAKLRVSGMTLSVDIPEAKIPLPSGKEVALKEGRFVIPDLRKDPQDGEIIFKADGMTASVMELLDHEPLGYIQTVGLKPADFSGTAGGSFHLKMPLLEELKFRDIKMRGTARMDHAIASGMFDKVDIEGGAVDVNVSEESIEARGDVTIKGVPAELTWQRIFYQPDEQQPPIRISAMLDQPAREKLGLKISHLLQGPLPVTLSVVRNPQGGQSVSMQADLTEARLTLGGVGWVKPRGQPATTLFDVVPQDDGSTELKNFKILGDGMAIDGSIILNPEQHLKSFYFSDFSFDPLTHVEISATVRDDNLLEVTAYGPSYNGKHMFQSLFSAGQIAEGSEPKDPFDVDLTARFGNIVGSYDSKLTDANITMRKRNGRLVSLDVSGRLNGDAPIAVKLEGGQRGRLIKAEARDAGAAFRLIGFYPKVDGGEASLEVNLDTDQSGHMTGTVWARGFSVLGDSVVSDVLTDPQSAAAFGTGTRPKQAVQSRIAFEQLRAPFSVGGGEFVLHDAYMNGPVLGATMRGRVSFKDQTVNLGGTYVPLYGLNSALGAIPVLGGLLVGRQGEGVVGITFAIQGRLDNPNVLVNPMSVVAPGIFRQIFEFGDQGGQNAAAQPTPSNSRSDFGSARMR